MLGQNLLANPGAEHGLDGWTTVSSFLAERYGGDGLPSEDVSKSIGGGARFFAGGPDTPFSSATQEIKSLGPGRRSTPAGSSPRWARLSAGRARRPTRHRRADLPRRARRAARRLRQAAAGHASDRGGATALLSRGNSGVVPEGTRILRVELLASRFEGGYDDAYFDNLRVVLTEIKPETTIPWRPTIVSRRRLAARPRSTSWRTTPTWTVTT